MVRIIADTSTLYSSGEALKAGFAVAPLSVMIGGKRGFKQAVAHVCKELDKWGVGEGWRIYITHAAAPALAETAKKALCELFPRSNTEIHPLTPVFITQGGPGCVAIQAIREMND